jgi:hypothetical protein
VTVYRWVQTFTPGFIDAGRSIRDAARDRWTVPTPRRRGRAGVLRPRHLARSRSGRGHDRPGTGRFSRCPRVLFLAGGTCLTDTRTTLWKPIMAGSRPGCARWCGLIRTCGRSDRGRARIVAEPTPRPPRTHRRPAAARPRPHRSPSSCTCSDVRPRGRVTRFKCCTFISTQQSQPRRSGSRPRVQREADFDG